MPLRLYYCDQYEIPLPCGHKFPTPKYKLLREELAASGLFDFEPAPLADPGLISVVHDAVYVEQFITGTLPPALIRRIGFPWSENLVKRTLASVGGTTQAAADALVSGVGGGLAGGTQHAFRSEGAGFCVFNDIAIAIMSLRLNGRISRAAVIDLDVHQGDGTAKLFEEDSNVLTVSLHASHNFPFRKQRSKVDIGFEDGAGDDEYLRALDDVLPLVFDFDPEIVFYQSGVDALASDKLGRLSLTREGLLMRDRLMLEGCATRGIPCAITLGGGYSEPIELTVEAHANTFYTAAAVRFNFETKARDRLACRAV
ncbi:MAG: histone deacetylase family protein [Bryobacteraceae bacterium]